MHARTAICLLAAMLLLGSGTVLAQEGGRSKNGSLVCIGTGCDLVICLYDRLHKETCNYERPLPGLPP